MIKQTVLQLWLLFAAIHGPVYAFSSTHSPASSRGKFRSSPISSASIKNKNKNKNKKNHPRYSKADDTSRLHSNKVPMEQEMDIGDPTKEMNKKEETMVVVSQNEGTKATNKEPHFLKKIEGKVYVSYLCNIVALSLTIILLPIAATEQLAQLKMTSTTTTTVASVVAGVSSIATLGGAIGKFTNGFICQRLGSYTCSKWYLAGLGVCSLGYSFAPNPTILGICFAAMEFFASIQWASLAVMLTNYYEHSPPAQLAAALTVMGLASTSGQILVRVGGVGLASALHWRIVARIGAAIALLGCWSISTAPKPEHATISSSITKSSAKNHNNNNEVSMWTSIKGSLKALLTSKLFWMLGLAHAAAFVAKGTERVLGTFYHDIASVPHALSGSLTLSVTLGLMYGLVSGSKKFSSLSHDVNLQKRFLTKRYITSIMATLGLAGIAAIGSSIHNNLVTTAIVAILSSTLAANIAFQYYQFPSVFSKLYGDHKAVCISFLDGFGFLLAAPTFAVAAKLIQNFGWPATWAMFALLFAGGSTLMMNSISPVLDNESKAAAVVATGKAT